MRHRAHVDVKVVVRFAGIVTDVPPGHFACVPPTLEKRAGISAPIGGNQDAGTRC